MGDTIVPFEQMTGVERHKFLDQVAVLRSKFQRLSAVPEEPFKQGDIAVWKEGLSNRRFPRPGSWGVVTRVFPQPIIDNKKKDSGSPYFRENLSLVLGVFDSDGDFVEFHFDGTRFEKASPEALAVQPKHIGVSCDACNKRDFDGVRFKCTVCEDFDLCSTCRFEGRTPGSHKQDHTMRMIEPATPERLIAAYQQLNSEEAFRPGDLVQWKPNLKNKRRPALDEFAIVVEVLPSPIFDSQKGASVAYFREPLDIRLALIDPEDGDWTIYHFDSRRFTKAVL